MTDADRDDRMVGAMQRVTVPDHSPDFWDRLDRRLALVDDGVVAGHPDPGPDPGARRRRRFPAPLLAVAAAVLVVVGAGTGALVLSGGEDQVQVVPGGPGGGGGSPATRAPDGPSPTGREADPQAASEATGAVVGFLDALGTGDLSGAAARLGPRSRAVLEDGNGSVTGVLREAAEGYGAWAGTHDRTTRAVVLGSRRAVVVVSGDLEVEGHREVRHDAFPVRRVDPDGPWLVEPWTTDLAAGAEVELRRPVPEDGAGTDPAGARGVEAVTPGAGTAWLSVDGGPPSEVAVGPDRTATWLLDEPLEPGSHTLVVAFTDGTTFTAVARSYAPGDGDGGTPAPDGHGSTGARRSISSSVVSSRST